LKLSLAVSVVPLHHIDMPRTQRLIIASLVLVMGSGLGFLLFGILNYQQSHAVDYSTSIAAVPLTAVEQEFKIALDSTMQTEAAEEMGGYTPHMLMATLPRLLPEDFSGVLAVIGSYEYTDGQLIYTNNEVLDGAADNLSDEGFRTLRNNVYRRLNLPPEKSGAEVVQLLKMSDTASSTMPFIPPANTAGTVCPQDAKLCPDGSSVGREGLNCDFAACGTATTASKEVTCSAAQRNMMCTEQYQPVCASYQVQCITTPCNPVPKNYGNSCSACADQNVVSYSEGECPLIAW
jgi:hypothetical protein